MTNGPVQPPVKLKSVAHLEQELGIRQSKLLRLQRDRDAEQERLRQARVKLEGLEREIRNINDTITHKNQTIFVLMGEVDWLLRVKERVQARASQVVRGRARLGTAPPRTHVRESLVVEVGLKGETNFWVGFSQNISEGGLFVATYDTRAPGERFLIEFRLPDLSTSLQCMVEVAWVCEYHDDQRGEGRTPGMGLRFVGLDPTHREAIVAFIAQREPLFFPEFDDLC